MNWDERFDRLEEKVDRVLDKLDDRLRAVEIEHARKMGFWGGLAGMFTGIASLVYALLTR
jgi:hypothetical protein